MVRFATLSVATSCQPRWTPGLNPPPSTGPSAPLTSESQRSLGWPPPTASSHPSLLASRSSWSSALPVPGLPVPLLHPLLSPQSQHTPHDLPQLCHCTQARVAQSSLHLQLPHSCQECLYVSPSPARNATNWHRPLSDTGRGGLPYLSQNRQYLRLATAYMRSVAGAIPFRKSFSTA